jgi:LuxR family maltose regulon positive regulatory protein
MSELQREWNELEAALQTANQAIKVMEHWPNPVDLVNGYVSLARIALCQGEIGDAETAFHRAEEISRRGKIFPATRMNLEACQVHLWLVKGDRAAINQWVEGQKPEEIGTALDGKLDYIAEMGSITLARALIAQGGEAVDRAVRLLNQLAQISRAAGQVGLLIEILALLALAYQARGEPEAALKPLKECLVLAQPEGYLQLFLDGGQPMRRAIQELCVQAESFPVENSLHLLPYMQRILSIFPVEQGPLGQPEKKDRSNPGLVESLSERELEVLALICNGHTNQEIAKKLVVTLNTVKKHNNRIFSKLGVTSRVQAVLQARNLSLVKEVLPTAEE